MNINSILLISRKNTRINPSRNKTDKRQEEYIETHFNCLQHFSEVIYMKFSMIIRKLFFTNVVPQLSCTEYPEIIRMVDEQI